MTRLPLEDLDMIVDRANLDLRSFDGSHILVTGGTGFVGSWLVESALRARGTAGIDIQLTVLSRDPERHLAKRPHLSGAHGLTFLTGDVRSSLAHIAPADAIVHAATEASAALNEYNPSEMLDVIVSGMHNVLAYARSCGAVPVLFTSSGAVYGSQPTSIDRVTEDYLGAPDPLDPRSAYHEGKRVAELLGALTSSRSDVRFVSARLFAFLGPLLPLNAHFAAGNFIADALAGRTIHISGDGSPLRSYLHPIDLTTWLWALLARGQDRRAYNVGSEHAVSIVELARAVSDASPVSRGITISSRAPEGVAPARYVPNTERARTELGLNEQIGLHDAIRRTLQWHLGAP